MPYYSFLGITLYIPDLNEIINAVTSPITSSMLDSISGLENTLTPLFDPINQTLGGIVENNTNAMIPFFDGLSTSIGGITDSVTLNVTAFFQDPLNFISESVTTFAADLSALGPEITANFQTTWTNLTLLSDSIVTDISATLSNIEINFAGVLEGVGNIVTPVVDTAVSFLTNSFEGALNAVGGVMGGLFTGFGMIDLDAAVGSTQSIASAMGAVLATGAAAFSPITPREAYSRSLEWRRSQRDYWYQLYITALAIEGGSLGQIDGQTTMLFQEPQVAASLALATSWYAAPYEIGVKPALERYYLSVYTPNIPAYADMIAIYVKEGYLPEKWVEIPAEFISNMTELGYSEFWTNRLWGKHWVLPAITLVYDMYHRTLGTRPDIAVSLETLRTQLKYQDYEPVWRDRLEAITWRTWRIFDIRTAWEMNIHSDAEMEAHIIDTGYSPAEAPDVADTQKMFVYRSEIERLLSEADADFIDGWITEAQLRANYNATPFREVLKEMRVTRAKLRRDRDLKKDWKSVLRTYALKGFMGLDEYSQELSRLGMVEENVSAEVEDIRARRQKLETIEKAEKLKDLTEARILKIWKEGLRVDAWAVWKLTRFGYSDEDAVLILESERGD